MTRCIVLTTIVMGFNVLCFSQGKDLLMFPFERQEFAGFTFHQPICLTCSLPGEINSFTYQDDAHIWLSMKDKNDTCSTICLDLEARKKWNILNECRSIVIPNTTSLTGEPFYIYSDRELQFIRNGKLENSSELPDACSAVVSLSSSLFGLLTKDHRLEIFNMVTGVNRLIAENVKCLIKGAGDQMIYLQNQTAQTVFVKSFDSTTSSGKILGEVPDDITAITRLSDGSLLGVRGYTMLQFHPQKQPVWKIVAELSGYGFNEIHDIQSDHEGVLVLSVSNN